MERMERVLHVMAGVMIVSSLVEALVLMFLLKRHYDWRAALASFGTFVGRLFDLTPIIIAMPGAIWLYEHRLLEPSRYGVVAEYLLLFVAMEFFYYWYHRTCHRCRWYWLNHAVHHSANEMNFGAAYRFGWTAGIMSTYVIFTPLTLLGFRPELLALAYSTNLAYQFWIHTTWVGKLGPLEGILNTPSAHRVHHAANSEYLDANYGGVLLIFDRLFGTYRAERDDIEIRYGLTDPLRSNNPFKIVFHQFPALLRDLRLASGPREIVACLFGPPSWRPARARELERRPTASFESLGNHESSA
jgi:sterol desaturase/sphingolipid hydroxylase (fatty acid hydroxylase superfamily)